MRKWIVLGAVVIVTACQAEKPPPPPKALGDAARGKQLIDQYACTACHKIPGIEGRGALGPALDHIASSPKIAGKYPNSRELVAKWILNPQAMDPSNTMPNLGLTPADSRDITEYLYAASIPGTKPESGTSGARPPQ